MTMPRASRKIFIGSLVHALAPTKIEHISCAILGVESNGTIAFVVHNADESKLNDVLFHYGWVRTPKLVVRRLAHGQFMCPGFIDTHTHAPQYPNLARGQQYELLEWLHQITFPTEEKFKDVHFARKVYADVIRRVVSNGTTTCCYYGTLHLEATKVLADEAHAAGQRAFIGKCNMDRESSATYVEPSPEVSVKNTKKFIDYTRSLSTLPTSSPLVTPVITPRFAISCTDALLKSLGELASSDPTLPIQTHISENRFEIAKTSELFPSAPNYAGVYDMFGLLRHNTILAHACHFSEDEVELVRRRGAGISHCPTSNFNIRSGIAPVDLYLDRGIKVGLGTDVSGGFSPSILTAIQHASIASKVLSLSAQTNRFDSKIAKLQGNDHAHAPLYPPNQPTCPTTSGATHSLAHQQLYPCTLLYLATLGGAGVCCLEDKVGNFVAGKEFDAIIVDLGKACGNPAVWYNPEDDLETLVERFLFGGDDRNIKEVYVCGRLIGGTSFKAERESTRHTNTNVSARL